MAYIKDESPNRNKLLTLGDLLKQQISYIDYLESEFNLLTIVEKAKLEAEILRCQQILRYKEKTLKLPVGYLFYRQYLYQEDLDFINEHTEKPTDLWTRLQ